MGEKRVFQVFKKMETVVHGVYSRKKESFLIMKIKSVSDEIKKIPIFSFLIIKMDFDGFRDPFFS